MFKNTFFTQIKYVLNVQNNYRLCLMQLHFSFSDAAPTIWNSLTSALRICTFRHHLKTHHFQQACQPTRTLSSRWTSPVELSPGPAAQPRHHSRTVPTTTEETSFFGKHERGALWPPICSAIEKHFTYLLNYLLKAFLSHLIIIIIIIHEFQSDASPEELQGLSLIHIWRCRRSTLCRSRWSPYH